MTCLQTSPNPVPPLFSPSAKPKLSQVNPYMPLRVINIQSKRNTNKTTTKFRINSQRMAERQTQAMTSNAQSRAKVNSKMSNRPDLPPLKHNNAKIVRKIYSRSNARYVLLPKPHNNMVLFPSYLLPKL